MKFNIAWAEGTIGSCRTNSS